MTKYEKMAYGCGKTFKPETAEKDAPCYDRRMYNLVCEARSEQGRRYNERNLAAWHRGATERRNGVTTIGMGGAEST